MANTSMNVFDYMKKVNAGRRIKVIGANSKVYDGTLLSYDKFGNISMVVNGNFVLIQRTHIGSVEILREGGYAQ